MPLEDNISYVLVDLEIFLGNRALNAWRMTPRRCPQGLPPDTNVTVTALVLSRFAPAFIIRRLRNPRSSS